MNFSLSSILSSLIFSVIGLFVFKRGKSDTNLILIVLGVLLMGYGYFTHTPLTDWGIGALLTGAAYYYR